VDEKTLKSLLLSLGYPVAYSHWKTPPQPPYILYLLDDTDNFGADDRVYHAGENYLVELYTGKHEPAIQKQIEQLFDENEIYWEKEEAWIDSQKLFQTVYFI